MFEYRYNEVVLYEGNLVCCPVSLLVVPLGIELIKQGLPSSDAPEGGGSWIHRKDAKSISFRTRLADDMKRQIAFFISSLPFDWKSSQTRRDPSTLTLSFQVECSSRQFSATTTEATGILKIHFRICSIYFELIGIYVAGCAKSIISSDATSTFEDLLDLCQGQAERRFSLDHS